MTNADVWFDRAQYDLDAAKDMINCGKYDYAAFFCHQAVEKALKSLFVEKNSQMPPYIHNLIKLAELSKIWSELGENVQDFLEEINPYYVELRYPTADRLSEINITSEQAKNYQRHTEELLEWLKVKKK